MRPTELKKYLERGRIIVRHRELPDLLYIDKMGKTQVAVQSRGDRWNYYSIPFLNGQGWLKQVVFKGYAFAEGETLVVPITEAHTPTGANVKAFMHCVKNATEEHTECTIFLETNAPTMHEMFESAQLAAMQSILEAARHKYNYFYHRAHCGHDNSASRKWQEITGERPVTPLPCSKPQPEAV